MSLKLAHNNAPVYNYLSEDGDLTNPAVRSVIIDKLGGVKTSAALTIYLVATKDGNPNIGSYSSISIAIGAIANGITWELSLNGTTWVSSITPVNMDCSAADVVIPVHVRIVADNSEDTIAATGNYVSAFTTTLTENPPA
jgi:hypothetical protein